MLADDVLPSHWVKPFRGSLRFVAPVLVALAYYGGAKAAFYVGTLSHDFAPLWPPNVVLFLALLASPSRYWWSYLAAALPVHLVVELQAGMPALQALAAFANNCAVALLSAAGLRYAIAGPPWLATLEKAIRYLAVAVIAAPALAALGAAAEPVLVGAGTEEYWLYWWRWYLSNALGALTIAPAILAWFFEDAPRVQPMRAFGRCEAALLTLGLAGACTVAFGEPFGPMSDDLSPAVLFLPVPLLLWAAVRFGTKGASGAILVVTIFSILYAMQGSGPFSAGDASANVLALQLFLMVIAAPMLLLAALVEELSGTNDRLRGILASISDCYFAIGADGRIAAMNARAAAWLSDEPAEAMIGRDAADILSGGPVISRHIRRSIKAMASIDIEILSMRHPGRWIELRTFPSTAGVGVFFRDITDRKLARLARHEAHLLLQSTLDALSAHVAILDRSGVIIAVNAAWRRFAWANGLRSTDTGVGSSYLAICDAAAPTCPEAAKLATGLRAIMAGRIRTLRLEYSAHRAGDPPRWFQLRVTRFDEGEAMRLVLAHEDITETWRAADASRKLLGTLLQAQDEERRRIARELHDSTAQTLLGVALTLDRLQKIAPRLSEAALALLSESSGLLAQAQREIRTFSYLLHPPALEEAGLAPALRDYVGGFSRRTGIKVDLEIAPELERLSRETELALYRIAQEALANIHRHSGSATARLRLSYERAENADGRLALVVEDDGADGPAPAHAFSASKPRAAEAAGVGLASMRERLRHLSGWVEIAPRKTGMTVRAVIPLENARQASPSARRQAEALAPEDALP